MLTAPGAAASDLTDKVVLITGAAGGIGRAIVARFVHRGAQVVAADISHARAAGPPTRGGNGAVVETYVDVTEPSSVVALIDGIVQRHGRLDCAVNNAGVEHDLCAIAECDDRAWTRVLAVNLTGTLLCMKYELTRMIAQRAGSIVNVASVAGLIGAPKLGLYAASKHGVVGLTRTAALECARHNVRINAVCPSFTRTPMLERMIAGDPQLAARLTAASPMRRLCEADEVAEAVVWLSSAAASFVNGHALPVDGGMSAA